ncbi:MAG TPA: Trp family transcriptional regulator [Candidatus Saccharimonadales bacterium]|nr:Trp family transcriptional regulator [Candidatus Saccharimonadales bacterium]
MNKKYKDELVDLLSGIAVNSTMSDALSNLLTPQELEEMTLRLQIFKGLMNKKSQRQLAKELNVSLATVSRGSRELKYGRPGLIKILSK